MPVCLRSHGITCDRALVDIGSGLWHSRGGPGGKIAPIVTAQPKPVVVAVIDDSAGTAQAMKAGASVVLRKPLKVEHVRQVLNAGRELGQRGDRRKSRRVKFETLIHLEWAKGTWPAFGRDVSEQGLALQAPEPLPRLSQVRFRFALLGTTQVVKGVGELIWADEGGRAGRFFPALAPSSRKCLGKWLAKQGAQKKPLQFFFPPPLSELTKEGLDLWKWQWRRTRFEYQSS